MDIKKVLGTVSEFLKKYRYAALVLVIGICLMLIPSGTKDQSNQNAAVSQIPPVEEPSMEEQLSQILSQIHGAGKVEVMLAVREGTVTLYESDEDTSLSETDESVRKNVVTVTDSQRNQSGLIRQVNPPIYKGAIVVCQGADDPVIKLAIVDAVSKITGLGANCISVLKMK